MAKRQAISPVIATVIIVAVTIAVAIAVAFWMTGIIGLFTGFEELQIVSAVPAWTPPAGGNPGHWTITLTVKNSGTSAASPDILYINNVPVAGTAGVCAGIGVTFAGAAGGGGLWGGSAQTIAAGETATITITIPAGGPIACPSGSITVDHGVSLEIKLHTASGKEYPKLVVLP